MTTMALARRATKSNDDGNATGDGATGDDDDDYG